MYIVAEWLVAPTDTGEILGRVFLRTEDLDAAQAEKRRRCAEAGIEDFAAIYDTVQGHVW